MKLHDSRLARHAADVVKGIEQQAGELPARLDDAKEAVAGWGDRARRAVRKRPGTAMIGAFALGYLLAKVARHA